MDVLDVKTPSPCNMISKDPPKKGPRNRCNSPHGPNDTERGRPFSKGYLLCQLLKSHLGHAVLHLGRSFHNKEMGHS